MAQSLFQTICFALAYARPCLVVMRRRRLPALAFTTDRDCEPPPL